MVGGGVGVAIVVGEDEFDALADGGNALTEVTLEVLGVIRARFVDALGRTYGFRVNLNNGRGIQP